MGTNYISKSPFNTSGIAKTLVSRIMKTKTKNNALVVGLIGELGAGKTVFVKAFMREIGVRRRITSPTFVMLRRFILPNSTSFGSAYHIDAYRIKEDKDRTGLGIKKILKDPNNIVLIEWADRLSSILPKDTIWVRFKYGKKEKQRKIIID